MQDIPFPIAVWLLLLVYAFAVEILYSSSMISLLKCSTIQTKAYLFVPY